MIRKLPEFENEPYPSMDNRRKGRLKIISSEDGDVAGVFVMAFRIVNHGENPASRIEVKDIVQEISTSYETILCFMCDKFILRLEILDRCWVTLKKCRVADAVKIIKTWSNGWATSSRYHEGLVLPCLFGCNSCSDSLEHYLHCTHLLAMWRFLAGNVSADPLKRWGLIAPELNDFLVLVSPQIQFLEHPGMFAFFSNRCRACCFGDVLFYVAGCHPCS